ncbi:hypothetical protein [Methanobrevibacter arboriphilus]|uniref:hypothetical protein n=1 Tax=Methanobrevibacter arboriphilus TaxID=39441 RepID=UPI000B1B8006|nr:hypothetical protein [Methanobrevibacter arboriphilus]
MLTIKVPLKHIEEVREILMETEIISRNYKILTENNFGYIPINKEIVNVKLKGNIEKELKKNTKEKNPF